MVLPLILLGTFTKLALAVTMTHRTRLWWLPAAAAITIGAGTLILIHGDSPRIAGLGSIGLGAIAMAVASLLRARTRR